MSSSNSGSTLQNINIQVSLGNLLSFSVLNTTDHSYTTECVNLSSETQSVLCPIPNPDYRNITTVTNISYPFNSLQLKGYDANVTLNFAGSHYLNRTGFGVPTDPKTPAPTLPPNMNITANDTQTIQQQVNEKQSTNTQDPKFDTDIQVSWQLRQNILEAFSMFSSRIANVSNLVFSLDGESCLHLDVTDKVFKLQLTFNSTNTLTADNLNNSQLLAIARNITSSQDVSNNNGQISFPTTVKVVANVIYSEVTNVVPLACNITTAAPTPPPQLTSGVTRYGVITNANTTLNSLGKFYGFDQSIVNSVFNYDSIDKYSVLVSNDSCFKIKIWIVIVIFPIVIVFPLWIDASIVEDFLNALDDVLKAVTSTFLDAINTAESLANNLNAESLVAKGVQLEAVARALTTEQGWAAVAQAAEDYANQEINKIKAATDYNTYLEYATAAGDLISQAEAVINSLSAMDSVLNILDGNGSADQNTARALLQAIVTANNVIDTAFQDFAAILDKAPDSAVKTYLQGIVRAITDYLQYLDNLAKKTGQEIDQSKPVNIVIGVLDVIVDPTGIRKFFDIAAAMNLANLAYAEIQQELNLFGQLKLATELAAIGAKQKKTALEKAVIGLAEDAAAAVDEVANAVANVLQVHQLENLANAGLNDAAAGVNAAANALGSFASGIDGAKRDHIRSMISAYLVQTFDDYKITRLGKFDENNPTERQILINDLAGTRIYSSDGKTLLFQNSNFCKSPFMSLGGARLSNYGCDAGSDPCGVGGFNCQQLSYWYSIFQYRVSFDFFDNHDLSQGGVVVGDFDGDGGDDIMCHLPGTTKDYDKITTPQSQRSPGDTSEIVTNNEIIYSPLKPVTSGGRFQFINQSMLVNPNTGTPQSQKDWCKDGVIRVGDFNCDKKDDMLCIALTNAYLLYSNVFTFRPASNSTDGVINQIKISASSLTELVVVTGDFDGDGYSDVLNIQESNAEIFYGDPVNIFTQNTTKTNNWLASYYSSKLKDCYNVGTNRILTDDINNDGKDDITCISSDNSDVNTIFSTLTSSSAITQAGGFARVYINDVSLAPYDLTTPAEMQNNIQVTHKTSRNLKGADGVLIFNAQSSSQQKAISEVSLSSNCLNLSFLNSETHINFSGEYTIPLGLLWNNTPDNQNLLLLNLEVSAEFKGRVLTDLESNHIPSFKNSVEAVPGGCYTSETVYNMLSMTVNFNANATMVIERDGEQLQGRALESEAQQVLTNFDIVDGSMVLFPVNGQMLINVLGAGFEVINHCSDGN